MVKNSFFGVKEFSYGLFHLVLDGFHVCNRAVGLHSSGVVSFRSGVVTCSNCLRKLEVLKK